jgi:hypothetical protein
MTTVIDRRFVDEAIDAYDRLCGQRNALWDAYSSWARAAAADAARAFAAYTTALDSEQRASAMYANLVGSVSDVAMMDRALLTELVREAHLRDRPAGRHPRPAPTVGADVLLRAARIDHPEVHEVVASAHCVHRFRERMPIRRPGVGAVAEALLAALEASDVSAWPPGWAVSDEPAEMWAVSADLAFPLVRTDVAGRWLAVTCLRRSGR